MNKHKVCPRCGLSMYRYEIRGAYVWRCCGHPNCDYQLNEEDIQLLTLKPVADASVQHQYFCPHCQIGQLYKKKGRHGPYWGCSAYPVCHYTCNDYQGEPSTIKFYGYDS